MRHIARIMTTIACAFAAPRLGAAPSAETIEDIVARTDARIGVVAVLDNGDTIASINAYEAFPMMSVFKFPTALAVARWLELNGKDLGDTLSVAKGALQENTYSPMLRRYGNGGFTTSYRELLEWSLIESDNNACDLLIELAGGLDAVNAMMHALGVPGYCC